jgi:catechol 2,3-dioxygenase-like lactoylglutathione lyase family enzyme
LRRWSVLIVTNAKMSMPDHTDNTNHLDAMHHVAVAVDDVAAAVRWYQDRFRCRVAYQDPTWALLEFANMQLALVIPSQHPPHIAFVHPHAERFGSLKAHRDGTRSTYVADSAGNPVEIMARD